MSHSSELVVEPIPISLVSDRYLVYDIDVVTHLRRTHHICGVLLGGIPQAPQQNVFQGLPLELLPEEAKLLVEKEAAYIVDDIAWHEDFYTTLRGAERQKYLGSLRAQGLKAKQTANANARQRTEKALSRQAVLRASKSSASSREPSGDDPSVVVPAESSDAFNQGEPDALDNTVSESLFDRDGPVSPALSETSVRPSSKASDSVEPLAITPSTSYSPSSLPENPTQQADPLVPSSYALFAHLHARKYFMMPGLRFGCDYNVYPGDPLRFHSHFLATSYEWNEPIAMLDLVGGGRLGTGVKKGFLIGGQDLDSNSEGDGVQTFVLEWAGM
ncbi:putative tRNA-splicing endonuclease subunit sen-34 [Amylocarpus encephaloides]|uniref:tRNA-splicing endonuclease subunit Sen34 n=1 Tax=Amylocarpus encephaloides TaxID=45428 RepID=A0A9P8C447_9HELO|nr:putative tRNA-splicing endonuclease subunit sen-34 [Amylocarpus encephaloides]